jgi:hypothetical protein
MALRPSPPAVSPFLAPACPSSAPINGEHHPRASWDLSPPLFSSLHAQAPPASSASSAGYSPPMPGRFGPSATPLLQLVRITTVPSPFFLNHGMVPCTVAPFRPSSSEPPPRPCPRSTVDRCRLWSTELWTGSMTIFYQKIIQKSNIPATFHLGPCLFP